MEKGPSQGLALADAGGVKTMLKWQTCLCNFRYSD